MWHRLMMMATMALCLGPMGSLLGVSAGSAKANSTQGEPRSEGWSPRDLTEIVNSGVLRVLTVREPELVRLQRDESVQDRELALLSALAASLKISVKLIYLDTYEELIPALEAGRGDLIAANMTITPDREKRVLFSTPLTNVREMLVASVKTKIAKVSDLAGKTVTAEAGTSYWQNLRLLQRRCPQLKLAASSSDTETLMNQVGSGLLDLTITDDNYLDNYLDYRTDLKAVYTFPDRRLIALAMNRHSGKLKKAVDAFLSKELPYLWNKNGSYDLSAIRRRHLLRVITTDNPVNYFIHRGKIMGFEYELVKKFAEDNRLHLVMIVPPHPQDMLPWLLAGRGDLVAATLTVTKARKQEDGIAFSIPYLTVNEVIVARQEERRIAKLSDLNGRTVAVRDGSSYLETLRDLQRRGGRFTIKTLPDTTDSFTILQQVEDRKYDLTLVDDAFLNAKLQAGDHLRAVLTVATGKPYAWAVCQSSPELLAAVNAFLRQENRSTFFNLLYRRYFVNAKVGRQYQAESAGGKNRISPFDGIIRKYAFDNHFDWCLIAAQIYHESQFDPKVVAPDGGMGLMQLMPATARQYKCADPFDPASNVRTGAGYMAKLRNIFSGPVQPIDQLCFALASYNGGYGHVCDARLLAMELGLNPNVWRDNVEVAMTKLSMPEYAARARFGFCRADIVNRYVRDIMLRFYHYQQTAKSKTSAPDQHTR